ncbi:hypothetical protein cypCar_00021021 [Cyprinus carpio]|nr:hypothetical protein cypCar_00021021 [Cyprinus carpio]
MEQILLCIKTEAHYNDCTLTVSVNLDFVLLLHRSPCCADCIILSSDYKLENSLVTSSNVQNVELDVINTMASVQKVHQCSSKPCSGNSTCVETGGAGGGGFVCLCSPGYTGENCQLKKGPCSVNGSRCQNGGTCVNTSGFDSRSFCLCPPGFTGSVCEIELDVCEPNPCVNGGRCVRRDPSYTCVCPPAFSGPVCDVSLSACSSDRCVNGGTCFNDTLGRIRCVCPPRFTGPSCELHISKLKPKPRARGVGPGHYAAAAHAFHKLLRPPEREPLQPSGPLVTRSQIICFTVLGLLTCLVVLVTTGIIFFNRCETWMANAKYSQLVRQQRDLLLRASDREQHSLNIILPEKIKLSNYSRHYTSI